ncbi:MAG: hypothetical protein GY696_24105 [Gammaproteobacteria bacterium]|nr:hypothetical protein [Gammaproteobacteria bacterium]
MSTTTNASNSQIDVKLCWQFFIILLVNAVNVITWHAIPPLAADGPQWFYLISFAQVVNFSINPYVYYIFNKRIRQGAAATVKACMCHGGHTASNSVYLINQEVAGGSNPAFAGNAGPRRVFNMGGIPAGGLRGSPNRVAASDC